MNVQPKIEIRTHNDYRETTFIGRIKWYENDKYMWIVRGMS